MQYKFNQDNLPLYNTQNNPFVICLYSVAYMRAQYDKWAYQANGFVMVNVGLYKS